jgi:hypothetical protein
MRCALLFALACVPVGCNWPETRMEPAYEYGSRARPTVSAAPAYTAGPDTQLTYSPDGSTTFVCADGEAESAARVVPAAAPAC